MKTPERSALIARALAAQPHGLPEDFAAQVAKLAEAQARPQHSRGSELALGGAFVAMIGVCIAGWFQLGVPDLAAARWVPAAMASIVTSAPWLAAGIASLGLIEVLAFRRRAFRALQIET